MKQRAIRRYIAFGTILRYLQDVGQGASVHVKHSVCDNIDRFFDHLDEFELPVTRRASEELEALRKEFQARPTGHQMSAEEARKLNDAVNGIRGTLLAEAGGNFAFIVTEKRLDVSKLLSDVSSLMAQEVFGKLPDVAQHDFIESGECIAFELPTAAAFHILRGTEDVLRHFYCCVVRRGRDDPLLWGPMVISLRARRRRPPPASLLDNLDNIRRSFRNPTQHPDKIYDIDEVQDLFGLCVEAVNRMVKSDHWSAD